MRRLAPLIAVSLALFLASFGTVAYASFRGGTGGGSGSTYTGTAPVVVTGTVISSNAAASGTAGHVTTAAQTMDGLKTFTNGVTSADNLTLSNTTITSNCVIFNQSANLATANRICGTGGSEIQVRDGSNNDLFKFYGTVNQSQVLLETYAGLRVVASALGTCGAGSEGLHLTIAGAAGNKTKDCYCTYDGTTYTWVNTSGVFAAAASSVGNTTTCPVSP